MHWVRIYRIYSIQLNISFIVNAFTYLWIVKCIAPLSDKVFIILSSGALFCVGEGKIYSW